MGVLPDWIIKRDIKIIPFEDSAHRPGDYLLRRQQLWL